MPMYEYECEKCGSLFEELAGCDDPCPPCPDCGGASRKVVSAAAFRTEFASPLERGVKPIVGYNPTGRKPVCPISSGNGGCGSGGGGFTPNAIIKSLSREGFKILNIFKE